MRKILIAILSLMSSCTPSLAQTWSGLANNQWFGWTELSNAISTSVFTKVNPAFVSPSNKFIRKDSAIAYVAVYDDWHSNMHSKSANQWVAKQDLIAVTPTACGSTWDSLTVDAGNYSQLAYLNMGTANGTATLTYTALAGSGSGSITVYYGNAIIANTTVTSTSGTLSVPYTYNSNYGRYVTVGYTSYNVGSQGRPLFNLNMSCISSYPANVTLTFGYCSASTDLGIHISGNLAPGTLNVSNLILDGYTNSNCTGAAGTATLSSPPANIGGNSSGSYFFTTTSTVTGSYGHMVGSVTINGTSYTPGQSFAYGSQTITVQINNTSCTTISSMTCP